MKRGILQIIFLIILVFSIMGCNDLQPKKCSYCNSDITWQVNGNESRFSLQVAQDSGKDYHPACLKMKRLEQRIVVLEKNQIVPSAQPKQTTWEHEE